MNNNTQSPESPKPFRSKICPRVVRRLQARREAVRAIMDFYGPRTTVRTVHRLLKEAGWKVGLGTAHRDMVALGLSR